MKELKIERVYKEKVYYIYCGDGEEVIGGADYEMAELFHLTLKQYTAILRNFNALLDNNTNSLFSDGSHENEEYYFTKRKDAQRCIDYLNEEYVFVLKLMGEW